MELEERIAVALSKGAAVETGVHTAELIPERRNGDCRELFLKLVVLLALFSLVPAHAQTPAQQAIVDSSRREFNFPGRTQLTVKIDSMDDQQFCFISIGSDLVGVQTSSTRAALINTPSDVDYDKPALLRIDDERPIPLNVQRQKRRALFFGNGSDTRGIEVPAERREEFIRALYTRRRLRLRYSVFPGPGQFDQEIKFGDFAAAYDRGVELCAWPKLKLTAAHPSAEELASMVLQDEAPQPRADEIRANYREEVRRTLQNSLMSVLPVSSMALPIHGLVARMDFIIQRDGGVARDPQITLAGDERITRACLSAVRISNPFPTLPEAFAAELPLRIECDPLRVRIVE